MHARLLTRTHYQVDEPAYLRVLVSRCTSPSKGAARDLVAARLVKELEVLQGLNIAAARYAIDLGRATGLIGENHVWTDRGHVLGQIADRGLTGEGFDLSARERLFFLRVFLETDGAALVYMMRQASTAGQLPGATGDWNSLANDLFIWAFRSYAELATDVSTRVKYRQLIQKRQKQPFSGAHSGEHQCFLHVQTLYRLGLIARPNTNVRVYGRPSGERSGIVDWFAGRLRDVKSLEEGIKSQVWWEVVEKLLGGSIGNTGVSDEDNLDDFLRDVVSTYQRIVKSGIPLCPLTTLLDLVQMEEFFRGASSKSYAERLEDLKKLQRKFPRKVHFHVNRIGRPTFLKLDASLVK